MLMKENIEVRFLGQSSCLSAFKNVTKIIPTCIFTTRKQFTDRRETLTTQYNTRKC